MRKALIVGLSLLALAGVGPAMAYQASDSSAGDRTAQSRNDGVIDGRCYSRAAFRWDAESFCTAKLACPQTQTVKCRGAASRFVCSCR